MTHVALSCLGYLWDLTVQATVILATAFVVTALARRRSASFRHVIWIVCLLSLPFQPLVGKIEFRLPATHAPHVVPVALPSPSASSRTIAAVPMPTVPISPRAANPSPVWMPTPAQVLNRLWPDWMFCLLALWLMGVLASLTRLTAGFLAIRALKTISEPITNGPIADVSMRLAGSGPVELRQSFTPDRVSVPMTWGQKHPVILFPADADTWPKERLRAALLHEMAHVRRADWLTQTLIQCVCAVLWFHPLVWLAARACRAESERACDDAVLAAGVAAPDYARHLLDVAVAANGRHLTGAVAMAQTARIETRLKDILAPKRDWRPLTRRLWLGAFTVSLVMIASAGVFVQVMGLSVGAALAAPNPAPDAVAAGDASQTVTLANGVRVRLLEIADDQSPDKHWWTTDGSPAARLHLMQVTPESLPMGQKKRIFAVQYLYDGATQPVVTWAGTPNWGEKFAVLDKKRGLYTPVPAITWVYDPDSHKSQILQQNDLQWGTRTTSTTYLSQIFSSASSSCTFKFGIAAGAAKTVFCKAVSGKTIVSDPSGPVIFTLVPNPHHLTDPSAIARGQAVLQVTDYFQDADAEKAGRFLSVQDHDRDILALDRAGRAVYDIRGGQVDFGGDRGKIKHEQLCYFPALVLPRIDQFELIDRPFQWASFPNVRLEPRLATLSSVFLSAKRVTINLAGAPTAKVVAAGPITYDARINRTTMRRATITFSNRGSVAGVFWCATACHRPDGSWLLNDATQLRSDGTMLRADVMVITSDSGNISFIRYSVDLNAPGRFLR